MVETVGCGMPECAVLLHNIRSSHNVGAIMRTADGAGVTRVFLSGYTPRPVDRFGRSDRRVAKTALGAEDSLAWEYAKEPVPLIRALKKEAWRIVGVEQDERAIDYRSFVPTSRTVYVFGNEVRGLSPSLRAACDALIEIPMHGSKESLNVAVAAGVILFSVAP